MSSGLHFKIRLFVLSLNVLLFELFWSGELAHEIILLLSKALVIWGLGKEIELRWDRNPALLISDLSLSNHAWSDRN